MNTCVAQAIKTSAENRHLTISLERIAVEVSNTDKELKWLRSSVGSSEKEYEQTQQKISELRALLEHERLDFCCKLIVQCHWLLVICSLPFLFPGMRGGGLKNNMKR
jgi:E3 ubiquitin-protein ligase BRE1